MTTEQNKTNKQKHILICCLPSDLSGVPEYVRQLCKLDQEKYRFTILTRERGPAFSETKIPKNVSVICDSRLKNQFSLRTFMLFRRVILRQIENLNPDILHLNGAMFTVAGRTIKRCRKIVTFHGLPFGKGVSLKQSLILLPLEFFLQNFNNCRNIFISKHDLRIASKIQFFKHRNVYIPNCASNSPARESQITHSRKTDKIRIISVAVFRPQKDHELLFKAFNILDSKFELSLVGRFTDSIACRKLASSIMDKDTFARVSFLGERHDVDQLLRDADVFVLTSKYEGMPIAALEALAAGLPIVMTNVGGAEEICAYKYGIITKDRKPETIANALLNCTIRLFSHDCVHKASILHFQENFSEEAFLSKMENIYDSLEKLP